MTGKDSLSHIIHRRKKADQKHGSFRKSPLFLQLICTYFIIVIIMISILLSVSYRAKDVALDGYLSQVKLHLESSAASFEQQIENFKTMSYTMNHLDYYRELRLAQNLQLKNHYGLIKLQALFRQQCFLMEMPNSSFCLFQRNGAVLTNDKFYTDLNDYFSTVLNIESLDAAASIKELATQAGELSARSISVNNSKQAPHLLFTYKPTSESALYGMMMRETDLLQFFRTDEICTISTFSIVSNTGTVLYTSSAKSATGAYADIDVYLDSLGVSVVLSIPNSHINDLLRPITMFNRLFILISLAIGLIASIGFAVYHTKPVWKLLQIFTPRANAFQGNEYQTLEETIRASISEKQALKNQIEQERDIFKKNLLTRLLVQESYSKKDEELVKEYLPQLGAPSRVICFELLANDLANAEIRRIRLIKELQRRAPECIVIVQMQHAQFVMLANESGNLTKTISDLVSEYNRLGNAQEISLMAGASEVFTSLEELHTAYLHAAFCMCIVGEEPMPVFDTRKKASLDSEQGFQFTHLSRLHNAVLACDLNQALEYLDQMMTRARASIVTDTEALKHLTNAVMLTLESIRLDMKIDLPPKEAGLHQHMNSFTSIANTLQNLVRQLIESLDEKRNAPSVELYNKVLDYLTENYQDASLGVDSIAEHFNVSKSHLYRTIKNVTGTPLSEILEEIRINQANRMLLETDLNIADIASASGYNSANTFYKVYRKKYGISPNTGRRSELIKNLPLGNESVY